MTRLSPWDPFMTNHPATQALGTQEASVQRRTRQDPAICAPTSIQLYQDEMTRGAGISGWNQQQGFYVYRSKRLVVQGSWLNLGLAKDEHTKLARIAIEFPSSQDHEWQLDVRKSTARPPGALADELRTVARDKKDGGRGLQTPRKGRREAGEQGLRLGVAADEDAKWKLQIPHQS